MAPAAGRADSLESRIGGRWLLYIGTAALVLGIGFFVKYAFDNDWINQTGRVLIGAAAGLVMVAGGHRVARRGYALYGQIVAGGGFAALYVSVYAALGFYGLIGRPAAFGLMVLITAGAALAADVHRSAGLATFAAAGGYLTPFLVGGGENAQVVLLSYDAILATGAMALAARRNWPFLNLVSYAFVLFTFLGWADRFYTPAQWVPTQVFLAIFGALFTFAGVRARRVRGDAADIVGMLLLTAPLVFHVASVANLQPHWMALLLYITLASVAGAAASMRLDRAWLRLAVFALTAPVLWQFVGEHGGTGWRLAPAVVALAIYAMNVVAIGERLARQAGRWLKADVLLFHLNALGLFAGLYAIFDPVATAWMPPLALAIAAWHVALMWVWRTHVGGGQPQQPRRGVRDAGIRHRPPVRPVVGRRGLGDRGGRHRVGGAEIAARLDAPGRRDAPGLGDPPPGQARLLRGAGRVRSPLQCEGGRDARGRGGLLRPGASPSALRRSDAGSGRPRDRHVLRARQRADRRAAHDGDRLLLAGAGGDRRRRAPGPLRVRFGHLGPLRHRAHRRRHRAADTRRSATWPSPCWA